MPYKNKEEKLAHDRKYSLERHANNPEANREYEKGYREKIKNSGRKKEYDARYREATTGWSSEMVRKKLEEQDNKCAICQKPLDLGRFTHPDHEHTVPPKPRDILCHFCNTGLGLFRESPECLESAAFYLRRWGK